MSCNLKSNVKELAHICIVVRVALVMGECADILRAGPAVDFVGAWKIGMVNIYDSGIRFA